MIASNQKPEKQCIAINAIVSSVRFGYVISRR